MRPKGLLNLAHAGVRHSRELMRTKEREPSTPTPPNGSHKILSPGSVLFPTGPSPLPSPRGAASKTTKTRRPSSGPR